mmetsp:Transcript_20506/g.56600  ORF Transcript_20506/g.56600 Transcript_20506/m.56600 type:complete len:96 (+) Transcript_20506:108-395(+)
MCRANDRATGGGKTEFPGLSSFKLADANAKTSQDSTKIIPDFQHSQQGHEQDDEEGSDESRNGNHDEKKDTAPSFEQLGYVLSSGRYQIGDPRLL